MNFHEYKSIYDLVKQQGLAKNQTAEQWYAAEMDRTLAEAIMTSATNLSLRLAPAIGNIQLSCERNWEQHNRPYYKIFPDLLPYFVTTKLDVPSEFFKMPFPAFVIRLPEKHDVECLKINEQYYVKSILVGGTEKGQESLIFGEGKPERNNNCRQVIIFLDINETEPPYNIPILTYTQLLFKDDKQTAEEALRELNEKAEFVKDGLISDGSGISVPISITDACLRIAVAVTFLATGGDKIVECDVLNRDLIKYLEAQKKQDDNRQKVIVDRAKRNHKHGFTIGRELFFPGKQQQSHSEAKEDGHELHYQHQRSAHWHWIRHGPGRAQMKLVFLKQITVRSDLPVNPKGKKGYKTK